MIDFIFELPHMNNISGGIRRTIDLAKELSKEYKVHLRIQKPIKINVDIDYSIGLPTDILPQSKYIITYSDNPYIDILVANNIYKAKIYILMLSYGMCLERERKNILTKDVTVITSTNRTRKLIEAEGISCYNIGFAYSDTEFYYDKNVVRENIAAIYFAWQPDKNYETAVKICDRLYDKKIIKGCISFGFYTENYNKFNHPKCLLNHYVNANKDTIRHVFSKSSVFIMPSKTEGLNRTPIEATLCGCPSVICDGAIGDVFFDKETCIIATQDEDNIFEKTAEIILQKDYGQVFLHNMVEKLTEYSLEKVVQNLKKIL